MERIESFNVQQVDFSRTVQVSEIGRHGLKLSVSADKYERDLLAQRFCVLEIKRFDADIFLERRATGEERVYVDVHFSADLVQNCVVTLRPVNKNINDRFSAVFVSETEGVLGSSSFTVEDPDPPEIFSEGQLEVGSLVAEYLALALDPYPRHFDAALPKSMESVRNGVKMAGEPLHKPLKNLRKILEEKEVN